MSRLQELFENTDPVDEIISELKSLDRDPPIDINVQYAGLDGVDPGRVVVFVEDGSERGKPTILIDFVTAENKWVISECQHQMEITSIKDCQDGDYGMVAEEIMKYLCTLDRKNELHAS